MFQLSKESMRVLAGNERSAELGSDLVDVLLRGLYAGLETVDDDITEAGRTGLREDSQCGARYPCPLIPTRLISGRQRGLA